MKRIFWRKAIQTLMIGVFAFGAGQTVCAATILYVPQDNRPVSYAYTVDTAQAAGYTVLTPPETYLSDQGYQGSPDKIWEWVKQNVNQADALVLSTDTLIYGGLVDSRKHDINILTLKNRLSELAALHNAHPTVPIYAFGTIMRSPRASDGKVEPSYYADYGPKIFEIAYWQDKADTEGLTAEESAKLLSLRMSVPLEYMQDWFARRTKNNQVNEMLIQDAASGVLTYFCLGHDDTAGFSQSSLEARYLEKMTENLSPRVYGSFPGADQLGLLLIARYHVDRSQAAPKIRVIYPLGGGADTMPHYENQSIGKTIADHVTAVGAEIVTMEKPDLLLAVNTPLSDVTGESEAFANLAIPRKSAAAFLTRVEDALSRHIPVSVADIFYSNGSDNTLLKEMQNANLLYKISAYNGWNTASNTVGYAVAQGILAAQMPEKAQHRMLTEQYLDNWGYQANIRKEIYREQENLRTDNVKYSGKLNPRLSEMLVEKIQAFAEEHLDINPRTVTARFPWGRLFETQITVAPTPQYPLMRDILAERVRQEAARKAAEKAAQESAAQSQNTKNSDKPTPAAPSASGDKAASPIQKQ